MKWLTDAQILKIEEMLLKALGRPLTAKERRDIGFASPVKSSKRKGKRKRTGPWPEIPM